MPTTMSTTAKPRTTDTAQSHLRPAQAGGQAEGLLPSDGTSAVARPMTAKSSRKKTTPGRAAVTRKAARRLEGCAFSDAQINEMCAEYPAVFGVDIASEISGWAGSTIARKVSEGKFKDCVKRGKPLRFMRNTFIRGFFRGDY